MIGFQLHQFHQHQSTPLFSGGGEDQGSVNKTVQICSFALTAGNLWSKLCLTLCPISWLPVPPGEMKRARYDDLLGLTALKPGSDIDRSHRASWGQKIQRQTSLTLCCCILVCKQQSRLTLKVGRIKTRLSGRAWQQTLPPDSWQKSDSVVKWTFPGISALVSKASSYVKKNSVCVCRLTGERFRMNLTKELSSSTECSNENEENICEMSELKKKIEFLQLINIGGSSKIDPIYS